MARHYLKEMGDGRGGRRGVNIQGKTDGEECSFAGTVLAWHAQSPKLQSQHHRNHTVVQHSGGGQGRIRSTRAFSVPQQDGDSLVWGDGGRQRAEL